MCLSAICDCRQEILQQLSLGRVLSEHEDEITKIQEATHAISGRRYAVKVYDKAKLTLETSRFMRNEVHILKQISSKHLNLLTLHESFESNSHVYLVMDMAEGGDLYEHIVQNSCFQEREAARLVAYLLSAMEFLHQFDIIHRDIKPENIFFLKQKDLDSVMIADFGLACFLENGSASTPCGTMSYMAPEMLKGRSYGKPVDLWAIGVLTYFIICGYTPFEREIVLEEEQAIFSADFDFYYEDWFMVSLEAKQFISSLLKLNPSRRLTASSALQHPWILKYS